MEKVNLEEGNNALAKVLLMMNYDMNKTLKENKVTMSEQVVEAPKGWTNFRRGIYGAGGFGTDEQALIDAFNELQSVSDYIALDDYLKKVMKNSAQSIRRALNAELGMGDANVATSIQKKLKSIGIDMYFDTTSSNKDILGGSIQIVVPTSVKDETKKDETKKDENKKTVQPPKPQWIQSPSEDEVKGGSKYVKAGMKGDFVKKIQKVLNDIATSEGDTNLNVGKVDGYFGNKTKQALKNFQVSAGLKGDGVLGKDTYSVLFREVSTPVALATKGLSLPSVDTPKSAVQRTPSLQNAHVEPKSTIKESLKKNLKQTLTEKRQLEENLIIERKIVSNRYNLIGNGVILETEDQQIRFVESIIAETQYLAAQGYSSEVINEQLFDMIGSLFKGSFTSVPAVFGEYIASWLLKTLGLPKDSYMGGVIIALVGNLNISDYDKFFTDCRFATNKIADSLIEGYVIKLQNEKSLNQGAGGFVMSALRNSVVDYFTEDKTGLIEKLEEKLGDFICPKLSKVSSKMGDVAQSVKDKAMA
jgi:peptidoglycan hydrolase-like protein with peptidoglycan-binding domain